MTLRHFLSHYMAVCVYLMCGMAIHNWARLKIATFPAYLPIKSLPFYDVISSTHIVKVSLHHVDIAGQRLEVVECLLGAEVTCAQNVLYLAWDLDGSGTASGTNKQYV